MLQRGDTWCIADITSFFALSDRMANMTGVRPNDMLFTMERQPKA